jgi:hypothetical protein
MSYWRVNLDVLLSRIDIVSFHINQLGVHNMIQGVLKGLAPGETGTFVANPVDSLGNPAAMPAGIVPVWALSDTTLGTITPAADGMSAVVVIAPTATAGAALTISLSATLADGTVPKGAASLPVLVLEVASFVITQQ